MCGLSYDGLTAPSPGPASASSCPGQLSHFGGLLPLLLGFLCCYFFQPCLVHVPNQQFKQMYIYIFVPELRIASFEAALSTVYRI